MRIILGSVVAIFAIIVIAVIAIPFLVSTDWIRDQVVEAVNEKTGRSLTIAGQTSLSVFPDLSLTVGQVAYSNPAGQEGSLVTMEELDVGLKLLPLISGGVEVDRLILTRPVFALVVDANGGKNWSFTEGAAESGGQAIPAPNSSSSRDENGGGVPSIEAVQLGDVRIVEGEVSYKDLTSNTYQQMSQINATLELPSLAEPMKLTGTMFWQGEEVAFSTEITEPQALTTGTPTPISVDLEAPQLALQVSGNLAVKDGFAIDGSIETSTPSVKKMARWLDAAAPQVAGLNGFSLKAGLKADETGVALDNATLTLDDITAEGGLLVGLSGPKPIVRATLAATRINLDNYLGGGSAGGQASSNGAASGGTSGGGSSGGGNGWSDEPIDLAGLRAVDADFRISAAGLNLGKIEIGQSALAITLKDAILSVDLSELQLYDGRAAGKLTVNGASQTPAIAIAYNIDNVSALPLLAAVADFDWVEGRAKITGSLASRGNSQRGLVSALNGETRLLFSNGAIRGVNVAQMARNVSIGSIVGLNDSSQQKTDFSEFSTSFAINRGIAQTNDIKLLGPLVRVSGAGVADLPNRTLNFRIIPKVVASIEGQGGATDLLGLEVPVLIKGPWSNPSITPDVDSLLQDPSKVIDAVKNIGDAVGNVIKNNPGGALQEAVRNPGDLLNQLTGGGQQEQGAAPIGSDVFQRLLGQ